MKELKEPCFPSNFSMFFHRVLSTLWLTCQAHREELEKIALEDAVNSTAELKKNLQDGVKWVTVE